MRVKNADPLILPWVELKPLMKHNVQEYVSGKNFVHRDLAARNVLISTTKQCKVTDFGLARDLYNYDEYQSEGGRLPIKWMSPEAIFELKFTTESDVWSFGVLMYELFSWGRLMATKRSKAIVNFLYIHEL